MSTQTKTYQAGERTQRAHWRSDASGKILYGEIIGQEQGGERRLLCLSDRGWTQYVPASDLNPLIPLA